MDESFSLDLRSLYSIYSPWESVLPLMIYTQIRLNCNIFIAFYFIFT